jgi:hypothetical protein
MAFRRCNPVLSRLVRRGSEGCVVISYTTLPSEGNKEFNINTISKLCPVEKNDIQRALVSI